MGLVDVARACKYGLALEHLAEDAACAPHVDGRSVSPELKQQLWWAVPPSHYQGRVFPSRFSVALASLRHRLVVVSRKTEIGDLESSAVVDEEIGCFHVSVQNVVVVQIAQALEQL